MKQEPRRKVQYRLVLPEGGGAGGVTEYTMTTVRRYEAAALVKREGVWYIGGFAATRELAEKKAQALRKQGEEAIVVMAEEVK